jgi:hypothetical protein
MRRCFPLVVAVKISGVVSRSPDGNWWRARQRPDASRRTEPKSRLVTLSSCTLVCAEASQFGDCPELK